MHELSNIAKLKLGFEKIKTNSEKIFLDLLELYSKTWLCCYNSVSVNNDFGCVQQSFNQ